MTRTVLTKAARLSVAPMMDWTDRHCRMLHRTLSREALLYTEMVTARAVIHGDRERLLGFSPPEQPLALQLGGSDPADLAQAAKIGADWGYGEINLNCGCPSDRVQSGTFGAVLMKHPGLVAECVGAMAAGCDAQITVKCRIGVDDQKPAQVLPDFIAAMAEAGVTRLTIHARKAWLKGLSPKQNRSVPPLDYGLVMQMKRDFPSLHISLNGGVENLSDAAALLAGGLDGVMVGRTAYHNPAAILGAADGVIWGGFSAEGNAQLGQHSAAAVEAMLPYIEAHLGTQGARLHQITRHMLGLFSGLPGARSWRRILSEEAGRPGAGTDVVQKALAAVSDAALQAAD
ncbi:MAG: tRNA dihydrouridine(20/20a) synthase DusA [Rhodobacteraceae bacterium]|nr:tRNA dihydrouridine(20/20a) synthase DusA [Paracoccaceae bacterium]